MKAIGCLPFLNVKPLSYLLEREPLPEGWSLKYAPPSRLAEMLKTGEICAAPVSSFACFANPDLRIVPDICIASHGKVTSVLMFSRKPVDEVSTIALDSGSLSGASMLKIILAKRYGVNPQFNVCEPEPDIMLQDNDACLLLGNRAMQFDAARGADLYTLDLGEEWLKLTGLPAVFAVWTVTKDAPIDELIPLLIKSKQEGVRAVGEIAEEEYNKLGLPYEVCYNYLANVMVYDLGADEIKGLRMFARKAYEHKLMSRISDLSFVTNDSSVGGWI